MSDKHISKHSLFLLTKTLSRSRSVVAYPSIHIKLSRSRSVDWCVVWCVCGGVCDVLWWCVLCVLCCVWCVECVVVLWWCVCAVCGEAWHTLSLLFSLLPLLFLFLFLSYLSFSFSFSLASSLTLALALVLSLSLLSFFLLPFYSLFSSLPFTPTNTVQSTDQKTRRPTLRRWNVMWHTVRSQQLPTNCTECSHLFTSHSSLPPTPRKKRGEEFFFITVLN